MRDSYRKRTERGRPISFAKQNKIEKAERRMMEKERAKLSSNTPIVWGVKYFYTLFLSMIMLLFVLVYVRATGGDTPFPRAEACSDFVTVVSVTTLNVRDKYVTLHLSNGDKVRKARSDKARVGTQLCVERRYNYR